MPTYTCDPATELTGQAVLSLFQNTLRDEVQPFLENHSLQDVHPDQWYPLQSILSILSDISEMSGAMFDFVAIGMSAAELAYIPPEMETMSPGDFLQTYGKVYQTRHRNGNPGSVRVDKIGDQHLKITLTTPYPDDIMYGVMYGYARRLLPKGRSISAKYDDSAPRRELGGNATIIDLVWK